MHAWFSNQQSHWLFKFDLHEEDKPRIAAKACAFFSPDDEDEQVDDQFVSCLNCVYRRWYLQSFECTKLNR